MTILNFNKQLTKYKKEMSDLRYPLIRKVTNNDRLILEIHAINGVKTIAK